MSKWDRPTTGDTAQLEEDDISVRTISNLKSTPITMKSIQKVIQELKIASNNTWLDKIMASVQKLYNNLK